MALIKNVDQPSLLHCCQMKRDESDFLSSAQHLIYGSCGIIWMMGHRAVQKRETVVITVPWQLHLGEWMQWVLPHKTTMTVEQTIFHPEISNFSHKYQHADVLFFSLIALCLFCSQIIIISQMLFLNRTLSYHKYNQKVMYSNLCHKISLNSLFSLLRKLHLHNWDLNICLEDTAWGGRWKTPTYI